MKFATGGANIGDDVCYVSENRGKHEEPKEELDDHVEKFALGSRSRQVTDRGQRLLKITCKIKKFVLE